MANTQMPAEVELVYEVMPCAAQHSATAPGQAPQACAYFRKWGTYHSYDYDGDGAPPTRDLTQPSQYVGRAPMVAEALSGCRKAPIMAVGINPNLPGWSTHNSLSPLFNDIKQFAHYFRYRETAKLQLPKQRYEKLRAGKDDTPPDSTLVLPVPTDAAGLRSIPVELQPVRMYENYQSLLIDLAARMGWDGHRLTVGEDVAYANMVACPSARWLNRKDTNNPTMPPMTLTEQRGIVAECFHNRSYFLRQLFQSLPAVLMVFSQSTADAFIGEMQGKFSKNAPKVGDKIDDMLAREIRLRLGSTPTGVTLDARVIFSPHITGDPQHFEQARAKVLGQLVDEAHAGGIKFNASTGHLSRSLGGCVFCPMLEVGPCDYKDELIAVSTGQRLNADAPLPQLAAEKAASQAMLRSFVAVPAAAEAGSAPGISVARNRVAALKAAAATEAGWTLAGDPGRSS